MEIHVKKVKGLVIPTQANSHDAAYDVIATSGPEIVGDKVSRFLDVGHPVMWKRVAYIEYGTNLYLAPQREGDRRLLSGLYEQGKGVVDLQWEGFGVDYHTMLFPRSSISKTNLILANSVATIDNGYRNQIMLRFKYLFQPEDYLIVPEAGIQTVYGVVKDEYLYQQGDKIIQIKACANIPIKWVQVDDLDQTERGMGGFGSSGK